MDIIFHEFLKKLFLALVEIHACDTVNAVKILETWFVVGVTIRILVVLDFCNLLAYILFQYWMHTSGILFHAKPSMHNLVGPMKLKDQCSFIPFC